MGRESTTSQPTTKPTHCENCGSDQVLAKNRCRTCYRYRNKHGVDRVIKKPVGWCRNCGSLHVFCGGRCQSCYRYHYRTGKERPRHLWDRDGRCKTCAYPLSRHRHRSNGARRCCKGYCAPCYQYMRDQGEPRPRHLWGIGDHGWCECGRPATALVDGNIPVCNVHKE